MKARSVRRTEATDRAPSSGPRATAVWAVERPCGLAPGVSRALSIAIDLLQRVGPPLEPPGTSPAALLVVADDRGPCVAGDFKTMRDTTSGRAASLRGFRWCGSLWRVDNLIAWHHAAGEPDVAELIRDVSGPERVTIVALDTSGNLFAISAAFRPLQKGGEA